MKLRYDPEFLAKLSRAIDALSVERSKLLLNPDRATYLADLRDYFFYLTLDALVDRGMTVELTFETLEVKSVTHEQFFFALPQLLSMRHEIGIPGEKISRGNLRNHGSARVED